MFQHTNKEQSEREIKKTFPSTTESKRIKYLGINLTKEVKDLNTETTKYWRKKLKTQINRKTSHVQ